jgi:cobalt-zinc-cadmium efflux system protein
LRVLLEATPPGMDIKEIQNLLKGIPLVKDVHDIHVWSISPELHAMSCHVLIDDLSTSQTRIIRDQIEDILRKQFHIKHTTIQMECPQCSPDDIFCTLDSKSNDEDEQT